MRPKQILVTSSNSPKVIPMDHRGGPTSVLTTPAGSGNYTVAFTTSDVQNSDITPVYVDITSMTTATTAQNEEIGSITALKVTLHSGTSVQLDLSQSDV